MNDTILKLENIDAGYKDLQVLFDVSLHINRGEVVALLGQNGAGKSTILRVITGLTEKKAGRITKAQNISYVPQGKRVFPNLTVEENVLVRGVVKEIPDDLYTLFPILKTKKHSLAKNLSGGEQQMVALARALIDNPEVLLLDEPSLGLSPKLVQDIFKVIDKIRRERNLSVLVIEHNLISLLKIADRGYVLEKGCVIEELNAKDFQSKEAVYEAIMGERNKDFKNQDNKNVLREAGYDKETSIKYTRGQDEYFNVEKVKDGATLEMLDRINDLKHSGPIQVVADIGCGSNANYLELWLKNSEAQKIIGIEPSPHMRMLLKERIKSEYKDVVEVKDGDWINTNLAPESIDLVVSRFSLHNIKNIEEGYRELCRILVNSGYAIISLPHPDYCRKELESKGVIAKEGVPMEVNVFDVKLHYFYHELEAYIGDGLARNGIELVDSKSLNWGTKDGLEGNIPNTLVFTLKKI